MTWRLEGFQPTDGSLVVEHEIGGLDIAALRREFSLPKDDPGYDSYPLDAETANRLGLEAPADIDWDALNWFLQVRHDV